MKKRYKILIYCGLVLFTILTQYLFINNIKIYGIKPNIILVLVTVIAFQRGRQEGMWAGFISGITMDMLYGKVLGLYTLLGILLGYTIGALNKRLFRENILLVMVFTFAASFTYETLMAIASIIINERGNIFIKIIRIVLPESIYNTLICIPIYFLILKITNKFEKVGKLDRVYTSTNY